MRISPTKLAVGIVGLVYLAAAASVLAQVIENLPSTYFPTKMLCTDSPFVAMVRLGPPRLVVIRIGLNGIEGPKTFPLNTTSVYGMKCGYQRVDLLVREDGSDHFSRLRTTIREDTIQQEQPQEINYSISQKGPIPPEIDDFQKIERRLKSSLGDWYNRVPDVPLLRRSFYEVHFVKTEKRSREGLRTRFTVDVLEQTPDRKIIKLVPLIREESFEAAD